MTSRVVKGSLWTLIGQVLPLLISLVSTHYVIRFLGAEAYGVIILVGLIPNYFAFADVGMGIASTKFGAEAFGRGERREEADITRTATMIALLTTSAAAVPIAIFARQIITGWFSVPADLHDAATIALRITAVSFVLGILASVINTPILVRLRMDINTLCTAGPKVLMGIVTPIVLYFGGFVVEAVWVAFGGAVLIFATTLISSAKLLPGLLKPSVDRRWILPLLRFGGGWVLAMIAAILLANVEKFLLARYANVQALAYYSVAYTFAGMATMFSQAMTQSLIPAFSQLLGPGRKSEFDALFVRSLRLNIIWLLPVIMGMFIVARPFFTIWAGPQFGVESTPPFYVLLGGLFFNILAYIPHSSVTASGRTDLFAKLYWFELLVYILIAFWLVQTHGIFGAAIAWSVRAALDAAVVIYLARRVTGAKLPFPRLAGEVLWGSTLLVPPMIFAYFVDNFSLWLVPMTAASLVAYGVLVWKRFADDDEKVWVLAKLRSLLKSINDNR